MQVSEITRFLEQAYDVLNERFFNGELTPVAITIQPSPYSITANLKNIKDTSRNGTYHNKRFKAEAEKRGLIIDYDQRIGHSITYPGPEIMALVRDMGL